MRAMALVGALVVAAGGLAWHIHLMRIDRSVPPGSWIAEARAEVVLLEASRDGVTQAGRDDKISMRLWYQDRANYRVEEQLSRRGDAPATFLSVRDGTHWWTYDSLRNTYSSFLLELEEDEPLPEGVGDPSPLNFDLGYLAADDMDQLIDELRERHRKDSEVEIVGDAEMLGYPVKIVEYRGEHPADSVGPNGENAGAVAGGTGRLWVAPDLMFVLRSEYRRSDNSMVAVAELTSLTFTEIPPERFRFTPPEGARQEAPTRPAPP